MIERLRTIVSVDLPSSIDTFALADSGDRADADSTDGRPADGPLLKPPDERVLELLDDHGGRMWQQEVVAETGYSEGRVSKLLCELEADDRVSRHWKDGQKVVTLPDYRSET